MTNSKAPWLTRGGAIALMAAAAIALAACSGGGGLNEDEAAGLQQGTRGRPGLQATTDAAARVTAEAEAAAAQTAKATAEAEKAEVARTAQVARQWQLRNWPRRLRLGRFPTPRPTSGRRLRKWPRTPSLRRSKADAALIVAQDKQKAAEDERDAALADEVEAQRQLRLAQQATTAEERRRQAAEAEQDRLAQDGTRRRSGNCDQEQAGMSALAGPGHAETAAREGPATDDPMITPSYRPDRRRSPRSNGRSRGGRNSDQEFRKWAEKYSHNGASQKNGDLCLLGCGPLRASNELKMRSPLHPDL